MICIQSGWITGKIARNVMEYNLELDHCEVNKGSAIKRIARKMQIPREEIFGCGDGGNDIESLCESC